MAFEEFEEYEFFKSFGEINSDSVCYRRMLTDVNFLEEIVRSDPEKILRFHLIFETEDGEGSKAKCPPLLGRAFVRTYEKNKEYSKTCERVNITVVEYYSKHT